MHVEGAELSNALVVGRVDPWAARLWLRVARPGRCEVSWRREGAPGPESSCTFDLPDDPAADGTHGVRIGRDGIGGEDLAPDARYAVRVVRCDDGLIVGTGSFRTPPANPADVDRVTFMVASCHQPFDAQGRVLDAARDMLRAARRLIDERDVRFLLLVGDQMYTDYPPELSLFTDAGFAPVAPPGRARILDCTTDEVRQILQARYRRWWQMEDWQSLLSSVPCYPMWDDHEIVDNWGSSEAHSGEEWRAYFEGARLAYGDYQAAWVHDVKALGSAFDFCFDWGPIGVYALDIRSHRTPGEDGRLYSAAQQRELEAFLQDRADREAIFLVLSVPVVHLPRIAAKIVARMASWNEDFSDRWSTHGHVDDRDALLRLLRRHQTRNPRQRVVLVSGDIHLACAYEICWNGGDTGFHQIVSSGITHGVDWMTGLLARWSILLNNRIQTERGGLGARVRRLSGDDGHRHNPYVGRNCGIVELVRTDPSEPMRLRFEIYGHEGPRPVQVFRSKLL